MSQETLATAAAIGTFVVIAATAIAAIVQLHHLRAQNQLTGLLTVLARVEDPHFNVWVDDARRALEENMADPNYRSKIASLTYDRQDNPWLNLANSYEWVGSLVKNGLIPEGPFMDVYGFRIQRAWELVEPVVAIVRRRVPQVWENFEYLVVRAEKFVAQNPTTYPHGVARKQMTDKWLSADKALGQA